jgi:hypothetical protein
VIGRTDLLYRGANSFEAVAGIHGASHNRVKHSWFNRQKRRRQRNSSSGDGRIRKASR